MKISIFRTSRIPNILNLKFDGNYAPFWYEPWSDGAAVFWMDPKDPVRYSHCPHYTDPNKVEGCGVNVFWDKSEPIWEDGLWMGHPTDKTLGCNVRLMRTITKEQW